MKLLTSPVNGSPVGRHLNRKMTHDLLWLLVMWMGFVVLVTAVVAITVGISTSAWEIGNGVPPWIVLGFGAYATFTAVPLYVAHGATRGEFLRSVPAWTIISATSAGVLTAAAFLVEAGVYRLMNWPQEVSASLMWDSPTQFPLVAIERTLVLAGWMVVGMFLGAGFYRGPLVGLLTLPAAFVILFPVMGIAGRSGVGPFESMWPSFDAPALPLALLGYAISMLAAFALVVALVRNLPLRSENK